MNEEQARQGNQKLNIPMKDVLSIILGGGQGSRLYPLTKRRAKPAVPLAGKYRLIDIPVSNCLNSGMEKIYVLTQFNSTSLNRHINQTYRASSFSDGFVDILAAQQTPDNPEWFQGTADAVRQYLWLLESWDVRDFLILSGDQLYRMDYRQFVERHRSTNADITLSVLPVDQKKASAFGLLKIDDSGRVIDFKEKPKGAELESMQVDTTTLGLDAATAKSNPYIASMGIYVFKREAMIELLQKCKEHTDFGKEIIPGAIAAQRNVQAHLFNDYWEDIGTIEAFYDANMDLTKHPKAAFSLYEEAAPIYTRPRYLPPTKVLDCQLRDSIVSDGSIIDRSIVNHSVLGVRVQVSAGCVIEDSLLMGSDFFQTDEERAADLRAGKVPIGIGENTTIRRAIVDKNVRIGKNVQIINKEGIQDVNREDVGYCICGGIVVICKGATIPDRTII
jgi:glucose-1-phosphate adenylyltransferase